VAEITLTVSRVLNHYFALKDPNSNAERNILVPRDMPKVCGLHVGGLMHRCFFYLSSALDAILSNRLLEQLLKHPLFADHFSVPIPS